MAKAARRKKQKKASRRQLRLFWKIDERTVFARYHLKLFERQSLLSEM